MQRPQPMNRLLQGDVGAGKTIVALLAAVVAMENGLQVAFMAPTEILAEQHYMTIRRLLDGTRFRVALLTAARRRRSGASIARRAWRRLGRISSSARTRWSRSRSRSTRSASPSSTSSTASASCSARRCARRACSPDVLVMTATPIPRTLALTTYGDLDVSMHPRAAAGPPADPDDREAGVAARGDLRLRPQRARAGPAGVRRLSAGRGVGEGRPARGHRDGRSPRSRRCSPPTASRCCTAG